MGFLGHSERDWKEVTGEVRCYDQIREGSLSQGGFH